GPERSLGRGLSFVCLPPPFGPRLTDRPVAHRPVEPCHRMHRRLGLLGQLDERFLDHILGRAAPLPRIKHQRGQVPVNQVAQMVRVHHWYDAWVPGPFQAESHRSYRTYRSYGTYSLILTL